MDIWLNPNHREQFKKNRTSSGAYTAKQWGNTPKPIDPHTIGEVADEETVRRVSQDVIARYGKLFSKLSKS